MNNANLCKRRNCVTKVGSTANPSDVVNAVVESFANELNFGEYTINNVGDLNATFQSGVVNNPKNSIDILIDQYGEQSFYAAVASINIYFQREQIKSLITPERYPITFQRTETEVIFTPIEVAEFIFEYQYTPQSLVNQSTIISPKLLDEVENFYTLNLSESIIGKFCALMPNVFAGINAFFTAIGDIQDFINRVKNFSLSGALSSLIGNLKRQITQVIDRVVQNVKSIIENFDIGQIVRDVKTFIDQKVVGKFYELKEKALSFFEEASLENFKSKITALIDYATNTFKNPTLEDIQYLIYRFCSFASEVERSMNALIVPLRNFSNDYTSNVQAIQTNSSRNTARAVSAGAIRLTPSAIDATLQGSINSDGSRNPPSAAVSLGDIRPITDEDYRNVTPWNGGSGDSRVRFNVSNELAWTLTSIEARVLLMRTQARFGRQLTINSARRSPELQRQLYDDWVARGRNGGPVARPGSSRHESGIALDVTWQRFSRQTAIEFLRIAAEEGFRGLGYYASGSFVHIDLRGGSPYSWGIPISEIIG